MTVVLDWSERLVLFRCGSHDKDMVVAGTSLCRGLYAEEV